MNISSRKNEAVKRYRLLQRERKLRAERNEFVAEGIRLCMEAVDCGLKITSVFLTESAAGRYPEAAERLASVCQPDMITDELAEYISDTGTPQGMFITAEIPENSIGFGKTDTERYVLLDGLQDSGNVGTVIRTCDALGINGVIMSRGCADAYSPKTVRSAMGSLFRLPVMTAELLPVIEKMKSDGFAVYAALLDESAQRLGTFSFPKKSAVIIGNEGNGVSPDIAEAAGDKVYIPIQGAESLNAAVAASVICWEMIK